MNQEQVIERLREAADRRVAAEAERHAASQALRQHIEEARATGLGVSEIAAAARLSRQAVYETLGQRPS